LERRSISCCPGLETREAGPLLTRLLFVAYFIEVGLLLILVPWSGMWERNYFAGSVPLVGSVIHNHFLRGAVSGLGVVSLLAGLADLAGLIIWRRR